MSTYGPHNPHPLSQMKTELVWEGKYDEFGNRRDVNAARLSMPLQKIETVDEPRSRAEAQGTLFDAKTAHRDDFRNHLIWGDNKLVLASLFEKFRGSIDLIYIDPPFDVGADFTLDVPIGDTKKSVKKEQSLLELVAYRDIWGKGQDSYLQMLFERLILMRELLKDDGSIYVHADWQIGHYIKLVLDSVFGRDNYRSEIVWQRNTAHNNPVRYGPIHDLIFFYTKTEHYTWNTQYTDYSDEYISSSFTGKTADGRIFRVNELTGSGLRSGDSGKPWRGHDPSDKGRHWAIPKILQEKYDLHGSVQELLDQLDAMEYIEWGKGEGNWPRLRYFLDEMKGVPLQDIWTDVYRQSAPIYSTQKPDKLLERVVKTSSNEGDLIADFFCGSGTLGAVCERLGRRWLMSDLGRFAIHTSRKRLIDIQRELHASNQSYRSFDVYNLGRYERQWWQQEALKGAEEEHRAIVLKFFRAENLTQAPSPLIHGRKGTAFVHVDGIDSIFTRDEVKAVAEAVKAAGGKEISCLAWDFEMDIRQVVAAVEAEFGVKVRLQRIPREIMEKNRTEVPPFFEVALLDAAPVYRKDAKGRKAVDIKVDTPWVPESNWSPPGSSGRFRGRL